MRYRFKTTERKPRRPFLAFVAVMGVAMAAGAARAEPDAYYESLRAELQQRGVSNVTFLLGDTEAAAWRTFRKYGGDSGAATVEPIDAESGDLGFGEAVRIDTGKKTPQAWSVIWGSQDFGQPMSKGDTILVVMHLRGVESALLQGVDGVLLLKDSKRLLRDRVRPPEGQWKRYYVAAKLPRNVAASDAKLELFLGGSFQQVVDVGGVAVMNLGQNVDMDALPQTHHDYDYEGREPDAAWRKEALARIERIRKGDLTVKVTDAAGTPVPGAKVKVEMTRHAFLWGSIIQPEYMFGDSAEARKAREVYLKNFNATTENFKWPAWDGRGFRGSDKSTVQARLDWAAKYNLPVHGHTPLWHKFGTMPFDPDKHSNEQIRQGIMDFLEEVLTWPGVREGVDSWDAINHPFVFSSVWRHVGQDVILDEMRKYEQLVPEHTLFINEGGVLTSPGRNHPLMLELVDWIMENDAPLDGVGFMGHFAPEGITPPAMLIKQFDDYMAVAKKHGRELELKITEFDMTADPKDPRQLELRDDYTRDFLITVFSYPAFKSLVQWGFWDGRHWRDGAGLYDKDWNLKSHGKVYRDLVFDEWWTEASGQTNADGHYQVRGFLGDYEVTVTYPSGEVKKQTISLPHEGVAVSVGD